MSTVTTRVSFERWLGIVLIALSIISVIFVAVQTARLGDATECQAAYNDAYTNAIQERSSAARQERQAQRELLLTFARPTTTPEEAMKAMEKYLAVLDKADQRRDNAQIPTRRC